MGLPPVSCHAGPQSTIGTRSAVAGPAGGVKKDGEVSPEPFPLSGQDSIGASWCAKLLQRDRCGFEYPRWPRSKMSGLRIPAGAAGVPARISVRSRDAMYPTLDRNSAHEAPLLFVLVLDGEPPIWLLRRHAIRLAINAGGMNQANSQNAAFL